MRLRGKSSTGPLLPYGRNSETAAVVRDLARQAVRGRIQPADRQGGPPTNLGSCPAWGSPKRPSKSARSLSGEATLCCFLAVFHHSGAMELLQLSPAQLRRAADLKEQIAELEGEMEAILGGSQVTSPGQKVHWTQTPAGKARLARSMRNSWHTRRRSSKAAAPPPTGQPKKLHWTQTPQGRIKMDKIRRRRWQKRA